MSLCSDNNQTWQVCSLVHILEVFFFEFFFFYRFYYIFCIFGTKPIFEVEYRLCSNRIFMGFKEYMALSKTNLIKGVLCKNVYFQGYSTFLCFCWTWPIYGGEFQTSSNSTFHCFYGVNGPF